MKIISLLFSESVKIYDVFVEHSVEQDQLFYRDTPQMTYSVNQQITQKCKRCRQTSALKFIFTSNTREKHKIIFVLTPITECDNYLFLTEYKYQILVNFHKSQNTEYWILFCIEKILIPNTEYICNWENPNT